MKKILLAVAALGVLAGCQSVPPGATAVSAEDIKTQLAGRTWAWSGGDGIYFARDGSAVLKWKGKRHNTNWTTERGKFCHSTESENGPYCFLYYEKDGENWSETLFEKDKFPDPYTWDARSDTKPGNRL